MTADHVLPVTDAPVCDGAIVIDNGLIVAVGGTDEITRRFPNAEITSFGNAAIIPGLVNCHSHLEVTSMRGALDDVEDDFRAWLLRLNTIRSGMSDEDLLASAMAGATEGARAGVTCFGDIGRSGRAGLEALKQVGLRGVVYQETEFSPDDRTADGDLADLIDKFESMKESENELVRVGISPHSPYTVGPKLLRSIAQYALENDVKISIHAAESAEEDKLLRTGEGFFLEIYKRFGFEWTSPKLSSVEYLHELGLLETKPLIAHCVTVSDGDIDRIGSSGSSVAHCPKSNAKLGHGIAPLESFIDRGIPVGLGSDSVASNNTCDILEESRFAALAARTRPGSTRYINAEEMLRTATLGGAEAMGMSDQIGSLESGKQADIAVVSLERIVPLPVNDVFSALVFASNARDVILTMVAGREVYISEQI